MDPAPEGQLLAVLLPGELGGVSPPDQPPRGRDQGDRADVPGEIDVLRSSKYERVLIFGQKIFKVAVGWCIGAWAYSSEHTQTVDTNKPQGLEFKGLLSDPT